MESSPVSNALLINELDACTSTIRFGTFEIDLESRELRKQGMRIRLEEKPFLILAELLEHAGRVVTRKTLQEKLWPDTHVRYDQNLNTAVNKLREMLSDSAQSPRFIETLPRLGYRFVAPVLKGERNALSVAIPVTTTKKMLAVLPFENLGDATGREYFADGLTEELIAHLGQINPKRFGVIARTSAIQYKNTKKSISEIAVELKIGYVLEGTVRCEGTGARITVQLIETANQTHLWSASYNREFRDILAVQADVARQVGRALALELLPETPAASQSFDPAAHESYLRGRFFFGQRSEEALKKAIASFETALTIEARCARSLSGIADCCNLLCWFGAVSPKEAGPKSAASAARAIQIDSSLCEPHASLALARFWYEWNWSGAEEEFLRSIELNPSYASAFHWYASFLNAMGRLEEAQTAQRRARELDPLSLMLNMGAADSYFFARQYDRAIKHLGALLEQESRFYPAHFALGRIYIENGMYEQAIAAFEKAAHCSQNQEALAPLAHAYALAGKTEKARALCKEMSSLSTAGRYLPSPMIARIHIGLGEYDEALNLLQKGFEERSYWMVFLKMDPVYDPIRNQRRFKELLKQMQFDSR
ncbi:MAG: winged helix-turn-helix domain-containing protein [Candidatus Acidiferrum sp.]|jgi:TolB-like protein